MLKYPKQMISRKAQNTETTRTMWVYPSCFTPLNFIKNRDLIRELPGPNLFRFREPMSLKSEPSSLQKKMCVLDKLAGEKL